MAITAEQVHELAPFTATLGIAFDRLDPEQVVASLEVTHERSTVGGALHGGKESAASADDLDTALAGLVADLRVAAQVLA